jgi:DNA polymerase III delta prime subunit
MKRRSDLTSEYMGVGLKISQILYGYNTGRQIYHDIKEKITERNNHWISLSFTDALFPIVAKYITQNTVEEQNRKNIASTREGFVFSFRRADSVIVDIKGHHTQVFVVQEESPTRDTKYPSLSDLMAPSYLEFKCCSKEHFDAVFGWLEEVRDNHYTTDTKPKLYVASSWDEWMEYGRVPDRDFNTVFLKDGQAEKFIDDLTAFFEDEEHYKELGLPYHRGYMLHGPAGTGKTSLIIALASYFDKNICFMSSANLKTEKSINELFSYVPKNSILVIEDVDTSFAVQSRQLNDETETERVSISAMLNSMDGLTTPHGLVLFMTTNEIQVIDKAILRPGRIDLSEEIGYMDGSQLNRMVSSFMGSDFSITHPEDIVHLEIKPADISELFKSSLKDRHSIAKKVQLLVDGKRAMALDGIKSLSNS